MKIVINVDDLGLHPAVNRAVETLANKPVTSASLLANGDYFKEALPLKNKISIGVHLNILRGAPLSPIKQIASLLNHEAYFFGDYLTLYKKFLFKKINLDQIKIEWENQIRYLLDHAIKPSHLDSEKHIHCWPGLANIVYELAKKYAIQHIRKPFEIIPYTRLDKGSFRARLLNYWTKKFPDSTNIKTTSLVWGIADQGKDLSLNKLCNYLATNPKQTAVEVICHPGYWQQTTDPNLNTSWGRTRVSEQWLIEYAALKATDWNLILSKNQHKLVNYNEV